MVVYRKWLLLCVIASGLAGASVSSSLTDAPEGTIDHQENNDGFIFEWQPAGEDFNYLLRASEGDVSCYGVQAIGGRITHESGIGSYGFTYYSPNSSSFRAASRSDDSVHVGSVNTAHVSGPLIGGAIQYETSGGASGSGWTWVQAAYSTTEPRPPLRIECEGSGVGLQFYQADALESISSSSSTGGVGAEVWSPPWLPEATGLNIGDKHTIITDGEILVLRLHDDKLPWAEDSRMEGEIVIRTPLGTETVPLEVTGAEQFMLFRIWTAPGEYEIEYHRKATNREPLGGIFAGFVLQEVLGEPFPLP